MLLTHDSASHQKGVHTRRALRQVVARSFPPLSTAATTREIPPAARPFHKNPKALSRVSPQRVAGSTARADPRTPHRVLAVTSPVGSAPRQPAEKSRQHPPPLLPRRPR